MKATVGLLAFKGAGSYLPPPCTLAPRHTFHGLGGSCTSVWHRGCGKGKTSLSRRRQRPFPAKGFRRHKLTAGGIQPRRHVDSLLALWLRHFAVN